MPSTQSLEIAAQCWCDLETEKMTMNTTLAMAFAARLDALMQSHVDSMELAWGLIANSKEWLDPVTSEAWVEAAERWRDNHWHPLLKTTAQESEESVEPEPGALYRVTISRAYKSGPQWTAYFSSVPTRETLLTVLDDKFARKLLNAVKGDLFKDVDKRNAEHDVWFAHEIKLGSIKLTYVGPLNP